MTFCKIVNWALFLQFAVEPSFPRSIPHSPCPRIFRYQRQPASSNIVFPGRDNLFWKGVITLPGDAVKNGEAVLLEVLLVVPTVLSSTYVGRIDFIGDKKSFLNGHIDAGNYQVTFPNDVPLPQVLQIQVNNYVICRGVAPKSPLRTKIILEHSLLPFRLNMARNRLRISDEEVSEVTSEHCGDHSLSNPLVVRGRISTTGEWPWLVPIFIKVDSERGLQFLCAGNLINNQIILTAAHCFRDVEDHKTLLVFPGRINIDELADEEFVPKTVAKLVIHPDFHADTLYSDLAVLQLTLPVQWSSSIYPICLLGDLQNPDLFAGDLATVVGWGTDEADKSKLTSMPKSVELPIVSQETCLRSSREFYYLSSNRTLCAGFRNGAGPCNGDSGGGLYVQVYDSTHHLRWYLLGIVSLSLMDPTTQRCDLMHYTVFTDVSKFFPWINNVILELT